jgi:TonB family protein
MIFPHPSSTVFFLKSLRIQDAVSMANPRGIKMQMSGYPVRASFGLLPEPEGRSAPFITSATVNVIILSLVIYIGMTAKHVLQQHKFEQTELVFPTTPPPQPKVKPIPPPKLPDLPKPKLEVQMQQPKITMPKIEPKPALKPLQMEARLNQIQAPKAAIILAPQPKAALTAAMPAQNNTVKASTKPVHFGETFGVTPNPNASRPATVAAIGNPYGGNEGPAVAPHGVVGSAGIGNGLKSGSNAGTVGRVAQAGIPGGTGTASTGYVGGGRVGAAGIQQQVAAVPAVQQTPREVAPTNLEVLSKPSVQYTAEARQLKVQGDVILRVTFLASGQVVVKEIVHGLGHGLDEEARRVAQQIRFRPATRNGQAVDLTTNITITFQLA